MTQESGRNFYNDLVAQIKTVTTQPVKYAIVTHVHQDHSGNIGRFVKAGATVITNLGLKQELETGGADGKGYTSAQGKPDPPNETYNGKRRRFRLARPRPRSTTSVRRTRAATRRCTSPTSKSFHWATSSCAAAERGLPEWRQRSRMAGVLARGAEARLGYGHSRPWQRSDDQGRRSRRFNTRWTSSRRKPSSSGRRTSRRIRFARKSRWKSPRWRRG